jgi:hypothetical protein
MCPGESKGKTVDPGNPGRRNGTPVWSVGGGWDGVPEPSRISRNEVQALLHLPLCALFHLPATSIRRNKASAYGLPIASPWHRCHPVSTPVANDSPLPNPVGQGFVDSLARPGGNVTGFTLYEFGMSGKWLQLLKEIAPRVTRAAVIRDSMTTGGVGQFAAIQSMAPSLGVEAIAVNVRDPDEIERTITDFGRSANGGLIVTGSGLAMVHRELIATLAARHKLPAVYWDRAPVSAGGLISYGADLRDQFRQAAGYVDRLLKGEKPADLPVQAPTKYELVINLKTAKALGLDLPATVLARADEVIE